MSCEICKTTANKSISQRNIFIEGCISLRLESIKIHETSANHIKATRFMSAKLEPTKTPVYNVKMIAYLNRDSTKAIQKLSSLNLSMNDLMSTLLYWHVL